MKAKIPSRPPRAPSTPKYSDKTSVLAASRPRRSAQPKTAVPTMHPVLEITHPLTARDSSADSQGSNGKLRGTQIKRETTELGRTGGRTSAEEGKKETFRSLSPALRTQGIISARPQSRGTGDKLRGRLENYAIGRQLGQGAYAVVRLGTHKVTKEKVAIKSYEKSKLLDPHRKLSVKREITILEKLNHQNTIKLIETIDSQKHLSLIMEYVGGCSLHGYIKRRSNRRIDPVDARRLFKQVLSAIQYCHSQSVTHRDVKLENILLDDNNNVKLIDFGFSTCMPLEKKSTMFCGTPSYMAPEIVARKEYAGPPADVWALGVLLYAMLCGCFPFKGINDAELYRKIQKGIFVVPEHVEEEAKRLIKKMMQMDPSKRPKAAELMEEEWLNVCGGDLPQPDPPRGESVLETDLLESLGRLGYEANDVALNIRPLTAVRESPEKRLSRKPTAPVIRVTSLSSNRALLSAKEAS